MKRFLHKAESVVFLDGDDVRRAPMAAALFEKYVGEDPILRLWGLGVASAGSGQFTVEGSKPEPAALSAMSLLGLDISSHTARILSPEVLKKTSIVLGMEQKHVNYVIQNLYSPYVAFQNRIVLLSEYLGGDVEFDDLIGSRDVAKYAGFAKWFGLLLPRIAYMIKHETSYPLLLKGVGVSTGVVEGSVKVVNSLSEADGINNGDVLVCKSNKILQTYGEGGARKASAIITDSRSQIVELSKLSYDLNIPCVGGTIFGTKLLRDEQTVVLDSTSGLVYGVEGEWSFIVN